MDPLGSFKTSSGTGSPGERPIAQDLTPFLGHRNRQVHQHVSSTAREGRRYAQVSIHHAGGAKPVWHNGRLCGMRQQVPVAERESLHSEECRRRIEKEMKNDPEQRERIQETKRKRREFIEKHAKKFKVDESA